LQGGEIHFVRRERAGESALLAAEQIQGEIASNPGKNRMGECFPAEHLANGTETGEENQETQLNNQYLP